ncbi:MAG: SUMF1/EgtB/PvdO family nonheme iron enzyme [Cyanobacteria bacterium J06592_8]
MPKKMALLIGVSEYGAEIPNLSAPPNDVAAMERILSDRYLGGFNVVEPLMNPNLIEMQKAIQKLFAGCNQSDLALLYFSGHSITDEHGNLYFGTHITSKYDFEATAVPADFIQRQINKSECQQQVVILDGCFHAASSYGWHTRNVQLNLRQELGTEGTVILSSACETQPTFEQPQTTFSSYTQYWVEGLEKAVTHSENGGVSIQALHNYAQEKIQTIQPQANPVMLLCDSEEGNILLAQPSQNNGINEYRQYIKTCLNDDTISELALLILNSKRREFGLTEHQAALMEEEVLESVQFPKVNREAYRKILLEQYQHILLIEAQKQYPFDDHTKNLIVLYQQEVLGLKNEEVAATWNQIGLEMSQLEAEPVAEKKLDFALYYPTQRNMKPELKLLEFDVVNLNKKGEKVERLSYQGQYFTEDLVHGISLAMVKIPAGEFLMGTPEKEEEKFSDESPQHRVSVDSFFMGKYPITQAQWKAIASLPKIHRDLNPNPSNFKGDSRPVERVSWYDAVEFCARLSKYTGHSYRLPSEAQWEYACRGGTTTPFYFGETISTDVANYDGNDADDGSLKGIYRQETTPVGSFNVANPFGLFDLHGNVWEWCADPWHDNYKNAPTDGSVWDEKLSETPYRNYVENITTLMSIEADGLVRGGSWFNHSQSCRSAFRFCYNPRSEIQDYIGFRVTCMASRIL